MSTTTPAVRSIPPPAATASVARPGGPRPWSIRAGTRADTTSNEVRPATFSARYRVPVAPCSRLRRPEHRHALAPAPGELAQHHLHRRGDRHREHCTDDAEQRAAEQDDGDRRKARQLDRLLHDRGLDEVVLELL